MKYRKKPVVIEAVQFTGNFDEIEKFVGGDAEFRGGELVIATLEGVLRASSGDWIIRGVEGEFYPIKDSIFRETYEPVGEGPIECIQCGDPAWKDSHLCAKCERQD